MSSKEKVLQQINDTYFLLDDIFHHLDVRTLESLDYTHVHMNIQLVIGYLNDVDTYLEKVSKR